MTPFCRDYVHISKHGASTSMMSNFICEKPEKMVHKFSYLSANVVKLSPSDHASVENCMHVAHLSSKLPSGEMFSGS